MTIEIADCDWITADALEMQTTSFMERFGRKVRRAGTFYIVPQFTRTSLCELSHCEDVIPSASYDCLLLANTPPHFRELDLALEARRIVRPCHPPR
jgi:hypothetical protein